MRHAYLLMVHNNFEQLIILLKLLDHENNDIFIHIDKKVIPPQDCFDDCCKKSKVVVYQDISVFWGTSSQMECEFSLLKKAYEAGEKMGGGIDITIFYLVAICL